MNATTSSSASESHWLRRFFITLAGLAGVVGVGVLDWRTGTEISFSILYLLPIGFATWFTGFGSGLVVSIFAAMAWFALDRQSGAYYSHSLIPYWNALVRLGFFLLTAFLLNQLRLLTKNLETLIVRRTEALAAEVEQRKEVERETADISHREQERLAYELHDQLGSYVAGVAFQVKALAERLQKRGAPEAADARQLVGLVNGAVEQVRKFAQLLSPVHDAAGDLSLALKRLGADLERVFDVKCRIDVEPSLPTVTGEHCHQLYRIAQEAARNAIGHGRARVIEVIARRHSRHLELIVRGDGQATVPSDDFDAGMGLRIMRYRAGILGGTITFPGENGNGDAVVCETPLPSGNTANA